MTDEEFAAKCESIRNKINDVMKDVVELERNNIDPYLQLELYDAESHLGIAHSKIYFGKTTTVTNKL